MLVQVDILYMRGGIFIKPKRFFKKMIQNATTSLNVCVDREVLANTTTQWAVHPCQYLTFRSFALIEYRCIK